MVEKSYVKKYNNFFICSIIYTYVMRGDFTMKKKVLIISIISTLVVAGGAVGGYFGHAKSKVNKWENVIYPGVKVESVTLTGKTKEEAKKLLKDKYGDAVLKKKINIKTANKTYSIDYNKLNARFNIDKAVDDAYGHGKTLGLMDKYNLINKPENKEFKLKFEYDNKAVKDTITTMEKEINSNPVNAKLHMDASGKFTVISEKNGVKLAADKLEKDILNQINGQLSGDVEINAPVEEVKAAITEEKLKTVDSKIATYSSDFSTSISQRINNITLATKSINGIVLMPGDSFSFNGIVGQRTAARGYQEAGVIIGNKVESGLGGGICQVSGTLYNAVLRANVKATERTRHTIPSSYVPKGCDATVDYGNIDFKFTNTLSYPMYIEGVIENKNLYFNIYSNSSLTKRSYEVYNEIYETIQPNIKEIPDPNLANGEIVIEQQPYVGYKVKVYRKTIENGAVINTEVISDDFYRPVDAIKKIGTKK